jgi:sporulation protein YlmC with PRC-barrel domain
MAAKEVHLELLLGKRVRDKSGKVAGHIEEITAEKAGGEWVIKEYLIGRAAGFERMSAMPLMHVLTHMVGKKLEKGYRVPWDKLDLSNPDKPRLKCPITDLKPLTSEEKKEEE